jgi:hypothetical protein
MDLLRIVTILSRLAAGGAFLRRISFQSFVQASKLRALKGCFWRFFVMRRRAATIASIVAVTLCTASMALASFTGPGPGITGNDTGGIIPYSPAVAGVYRQLAADYCASWGRLSHITSVRPRYGDYIGFVCIDKPWMIH